VCVGRGRFLRPRSPRLPDRPFLSLYNNIKAPSQLQPSATYYLFKDGIQPKWEDPKNANGGCWTATLPRAANPGQLLDAWWLHLVRGPAAAAAARWCAPPPRRVCAPSAVLHCVFMASSTWGNVLFQFAAPAYGHTMGRLPTTAPAPSCCPLSEGAGLHRRAV
jgi:hypothetical protein